MTAAIFLTSAILLMASRKLIVSRKFGGCSRIFPHAIIPFVVLFCLAGAQLVAQTGQDKKQAPAQNLGQNSSRDLKRMPKARELGRDLRVTRDLATGELRAVVPGSGAAGAAAVTGPAIRASVALVGVGCTVIAADGTRVPGLRAEDFRLWEDGAEQGITSFDAAATPAKIAVIFDASPSVARELGDMRDAARSLERSPLGAQDEVAVVTFADRTTLLLPFSRDRALCGLRAFLARTQRSSEQLPVEHLSSPCFWPRGSSSPPHPSRRGLFWRRPGPQGHHPADRWDGQRPGPHLGPRDHAFPTAVAATSRV